MIKSLVTEYEDGPRKKIQKKWQDFFVVAIFLVHDTNTLHVFTLPGRQIKWL